MSQLHLHYHDLFFYRRNITPLSACVPRRLSKIRLGCGASGPSGSATCTATTTNPTTSSSSISSTSAATVLTTTYTDLGDDPQSCETTAEIDSELQLLFQLLPPDVRSVLKQRPDVGQLVEVVMDLGRVPTARFPHGDVVLSSETTTAEDLAQVISQVCQFDGDNRAGINSTLHRISCIRNRAGRIVGLTCRVGRAVPGAAELVRDLVMAARSVLLLGRPGVGKTTALREICRIAADECQQRVIVVDTSNEIGGDGDVPHPSIGGARRMQVPRPEAQHAVMVEAVENHMPQMVVIDEVSTVAECTAARTIAQRGVQLVASAHGNLLSNLIQNPTLSDLVGGIQSVTLGDEEARKRGVQKSILERAAPPTFDVVVEMEERGKWRVHLDVGAAVDTILAGGEAPGQVRFLDSTGQVARAKYMGTVRRTDSNGTTSTSEWWADEAGDREPLLWPVRQDVQTSSPVSSSSSPNPIAKAQAVQLPKPHKALGTDDGARGHEEARLEVAASSSSSQGSGATAGAFSHPASIASATADTAAIASFGAAATSLSRSTGGVWNSSSSNSSSSSSSNSSSSNSGGDARVYGHVAPNCSGRDDPWVNGNGAATSLPQLRAYLVMDDESAARVRAVLGLLSREAYEAALATAAGGSSDGTGAGGGGGASGAAHGSQNLIQLVPDLDIADMVIGTVSKLRKNPKIRNAARKRELPVYALTATSTSALLRNLCPLLGLDPLAVAEVVRAGSGGGGGGNDVAEATEKVLSPSSSLDEDNEDGGEGLATSGTTASGQRRSLQLSAADDYADLLATTVRELRYAPLDRSYAQHILGRFVEEMSATPMSAASGPTHGSVEGAVRPSSLAAVAWACSFVKHRKKFVEASRRDLSALAAACGQCWGELSGHDLLRVATGFAGLRLAPPSEAWLKGLMDAAREVLGTPGAVADG
ncbi:hypothetical protein Vretimale_4013, partial [Volvox reticuliferus]